ncbi:hypothetical protein PHYBOEH_006866 [Phytophthora boehmeriae]|uniref:Uncharacterized protein n=1 Tax=Phytophthora boehmeriae TaxID=109152 RepID=A0A8T1X743_9STRA|nr:hypothetical protein PHYBOEH_006866 [Phytophthora boehmeriae]
MASLDRTIRFFEDRGIDKTSALRVVACHVSLTHYSLDTMETKIAWLSELGLSDDKINVTIMRHPNILGISFDKLNAIKEWYIKHGVSEKKLPYVFNVFPQAASSSIEANLEPKVKLLKKNGFSDSQVARALSLTPQVFTHSVDKLQSNIDYLADVGVPREELPRMVAMMPQCLGMKQERIQATLNAADEMFGPETALEVLLSNCRIVTYNINGMRRAFKYLVSLGFAPERLQMNTRYITRSVNGILRPRSKFLIAQGVDVVMTVNWIMLPEKHFIERYPDYTEYLRQYKARQRKKLAAIAAA